MPHLVPISPQWRMNFWATGVSEVFVLSLISVLTEYTERMAGLSSLFWSVLLAAFRGFPRPIPVGRLEHADFRNDRHQFRHIDLDPGSLPFVTVDIQVEVRAIQHAQAFANVAQPDSFDIYVRHFFFRDSHAVIFDLDMQPAIAVGSPEINPTAFQFRGQPVLQAVLDNGLKQHAGDKGIERMVIDLFHDLEVVLAEAGDLNVEIIIDKRELLAQGHKSLVLPKKPPQNVAQLQHDAPGRVGVYANERRDRVQGVEQEVRVDLASERIHPGAEQELLVSLEVHLDACVVPDL